MSVETLAAFSGSSGPHVEAAQCGAPRHVGAVGTNMRPLWGRGFVLTLLQIFGPAGAGESSRGRFYEHNDPLEPALCLGLEPSCIQRDEAPPTMKIITKGS
jgi:hypothetical protein